MTAFYGNTGIPFANNAEIGVGFSDAALLAASVMGFLILASTVSSTVVMRLKSSKEAEKEQRAGRNDYEQQLVHADVSTLNRAQRQARARAILKQQRRALINEDHSDDELDVGLDIDAEGSEDGDALSRNELQVRAAKATEKYERRVLEDERREKQEKQAQDDALKQKREEEEREDARKQEAARLAEKKRKEELEIAEFEAFNVFLSSPIRSQSVQEWIDETKDKGTVLMTEIATSFELPGEKVVQRIQELIKEGRVAGVMEENGRFIFIAEDELRSIAESLIECGSLSLTDVAAVCNKELGSVRAIRVN
jgi:phage-related minor tail protein